MCGPEHRTCFRCIADKLIQVCFDESNRIANHCSDGAARWAGENLHAAAMEAAKLVRQNTTLVGPLAPRDATPPACSMPLPDTSEEYYIRRDEVVRYIDREVNPARRANGLDEIREHEARECFRIIVDFLRKWESPTTNAERLRSPRLGGDKQDALVRGAP